MYTTRLTDYPQEWDAEPTEEEMTDAEYEMERALDEDFDMWSDLSE